MYTLDNFYKSREWETLRKVIMTERVDADGNIICAHCGQPILKKYDCVAHHRIELTEENVNDANIALNPENIELIHFGCHNKKHARAKGKGGNSFWQGVYLVYGSPCSGKTTWVMENATAEDLILDVDRIWECVTVSDRLNKNSRLKSNVFGVRDCIIKQIADRLGRWRYAYIVGGYPLRTDRDYICMTTKAVPVFIDETMETCLDRAPNEDWKGYIRDWFDAYVE